MTNSPITETDDRLKKAIEAIHSLNNSAASAGDIRKIWQELRKAYKGTNSEPHNLDFFPIWVLGEFKEMHIEIEKIICIGYSE